MFGTDEITITTDLQQSIAADLAWNYRIIPKSIDGDQYVLYIDDKQDVDLIIDELNIVFGHSVQLEEVNGNKITKALNQYYRKSDSGQESVYAADDYDQEYLRKLILEAKALGSSDIHVEIYKGSARIRMRIDGILIDKYKIKKEEYAQLVSSIKVISQGMHITEKRLPQDGRMRIEYEDDSLDLRVSTIPTLEGEKCVMRLLASDASHLRLNDLGFSEIEVKRYREGTMKANGIVLISGPTGSGKTTTLYATLKELNQVKTNIMTVEDPIEYTLDGINQVQLNDRIGLTFSAALKSFLRQDPDIIMLGEIRDKETAEMAIRAALTGHLVLSTVHTNSAWEIVSRLTDMGIPPFLLASTLNLAIAQRLLRKLCNNCKKEEDFDRTLLPTNSTSEIKCKRHFLPIGCDDCYYTGYKGRQAIYEIIPIDHELSEKIKSDNQISGIERILNKKSVDMLKDNAIKVFEAGNTSLEEIYQFLL
ncbi:MAG: type II/IV secretion system protein [Flavobacteriales bacterium]|nr:type II/IV secretion system protein [Flavobacteriales bacterium]